MLEDISLARLKLLKEDSDRNVAFRRFWIVPQEDAMKAMVYTKYGPPDVLRLKEVKKPIPKDNEVVIKVRAVAVMPFDWHIRRGTPAFPVRIFSGLIKPRINILGFNLAGEIESVGRNVKQFEKDDEVFGFSTSGGANAEYVRVSEKDVIKKPVNMTYEEAAAVPLGALTALQALRDKGNIRPGQKVLINGASGSVGTFAIQIAKSFGAKVTAVCSTSNLNMVRSLGADKVIDYTKEDFTKSSQTYDIIFDAVAKNSFLNCKSSLNHKGIYITTDILRWNFLLMLWTSIIGSKKAKTMLTNMNAKDLTLINDLIEAGKIKSVIDKCYPLSQIAEAHRYVEKGHKKGNVVVTVEHI